MALIKCKVVGPNEVLGAQTGDEVMIDDELINVAALEDGGHVEILGADNPDKLTDAGQHAMQETELPSLSAQPSGVQAGAPE